LHWRFEFDGGLIKLLSEEMTGGQRSAWSGNRVQDAGLPDSRELVVLRRRACGRDLGRIVPLNCEFSRGKLTLSREGKKPDLLKVQKVEECLYPLVVFMLALGQIIFRVRV
jgi:hypothetical protein